MRKQTTGQMKVVVGYSGSLLLAASLLIAASCGADCDRLSRVVVVILNQEGTHLSQDSNGRAWHPPEQDACQKEPHRKPTIHRIPPDWPDVKGSWTIFPLIPRLVNLHPNASWVLFVQDNSRFDWSDLLRLTRQFDHRKEWFLGHALHDESPTIIHHFAFHLDPSGFHYPLFDSGFLFSRALVHRFNQQLSQRPVAADFAIDPQHELALYLRKELAVNLTHSPAFCLSQVGSGCATWIQSATFCERSGGQHPLGIHFAVKTCRKFHESRVKNVVQRTWATQVRPGYLVYYSDVKDASIPTLVLDGIRNTETGHCAKTMALMADMSRKVDAPDKRLDWLVIADDDTLLSVQRLERLLSCYDPSRPMLMGQRYGYANNHRHGYDYVTGGGGMVLSRAAVKLMGHSRSCACPQADTPDDMWIGACASYLNIEIVHHSGFHQARPDDYPAAQLRNQFVISFHKHWMIDPVDVYDRWFAQEHYQRHRGSDDPADGVADVPSVDRRHLLTPETRDEL